GALPVERINDRFNKNWPTELFTIIKDGYLDRIKKWYQSVSPTERSSLSHAIIPFTEIEYGPLYRHPRKIWGIGLNYKNHAADLSEQSPETEPASFMKPDSTIIGPHDTILIPHQSARTTAEA